MTDDLPERAHRFPPVTPGPLAVLALGSTAQSFGPLLPVWIALALFNGAMFVGMRAWILSVGVETPQGLAEAALEAVATGLGNGVLAGFATRSFLGAGSWRLDRGLASFTVIQVALALLETIVPTLVMRGSDAAGISGGATSVSGALVSFAAWLALLPLEAMFVPWQVGRLMGEGRVTVGLSWRAMRGALGAYLMAYFAVLGPPMLAYVYGWSLYVYTGSAVGLGLTLVSYSAAAMLSAALAAHLYRLRLGGGRA